MELFELIENINAKEDFIFFLSMLKEDFESHQNEWENTTVPSFPESIARWIEDYSDSPANDIDWEAVDFRTFAKILYMGKIYE